MKNSILKLKYILILFSLLAFIACSKDSEVGPIGPEGPQGVQGEQGPQGNPGQDGADGQDGEDGNANVIASEWIASEHSTTQMQIESTFTIDDDRISEGLISSGLIMVYGDTDVFGVYPLPDVFSNQVYSFSLSSGQIGFEAYSLDGSEEIYETFKRFRYIMIPSNSSTRKSSKTNVLKKLKQVGIDINDYQQVADYFGLED